MKTFLGVPIRFQGKPVGNLYLAEKEGGLPFSASDQRAVELLAARAATALQTARLYRAEFTERVWLQNILDEMPEGILFLDQFGRINQANQAAREFLASRHPSTTAKNAGGSLESMVLDLRSSTGDQLPWDESHLVHAATRGESIASIELRLRHHSGRTVPVLATASPVLGREAETANPRRPVAVVVFQDLTLLKELERKRELSIAVVAHELRQPLSVIRIAAERLARGEAGPAEMTKLISSLASASGRLSRLVGDLVDASSIEMHKLNLRRRPIALRAWMEQMVSQYENASKDRPMLLHAPAELPELVADPDRLEQVLSNLITNALKYGSPDTPIEIQVSTTEDEVTFAVVNQGTGLSSDEIGHLFERFFRTESAKETRHGLGLGLYIAKGIVEAHGGRIEAASAPGGPTKIRFHLPLHPAPAQIVSTTSAEAHPP